MKIFKLLRWALPGLLFGWMLTGPASAAPFSISHTGTTSSSSIPGITGGETYDITLVFDNGGATALSQTWTGADLRCVIWRFNNARNFVYTQNLVADPPGAIGGSAATDAAGALTSNFSSVNDFPTSGSNYTVTGGSLTLPLAWFANSINGIFFDTNTTQGVNDGSGGVQMAAGGWSNPVPFAGDCAGLLLGPPPATVPTLSDFALWLMTLSLMVAGFFYTRRWAGA